MEIGVRELWQARDPGTPDRDLARLAGGVLTAQRARKGGETPAIETAVLAAVAGNPNTPPVVLYELAPRFPGEVVRNPALVFLLLEDPALLGKIPDRALLVILAHAEAPPAWLALAAQRSERWIHRLVAANPRTPPECLAHLAGSADATQRIAVAGNPGTPPAVLARCARTEDDAGPTLFALRRAVAQNPSAPIPTIEHLAADAALLPFAATNPTLPAYLFEVLAEHEAAAVRAALATQPRLSPRLRRRLAADPAPEVRQALARHERDPEALRRLAEHDTDLHRALVQNPSAPAELLVRLTRAPLTKTRRAARKALAARAADGGSAPKPP